MKKFIGLLLAIVLVNCTTDSDYNDNENSANIPEATILGRWVLPGFESNIRIEFTEAKRFDIYGSDGVFPTLDEFNADNLDLRGLDWVYEGEKISVDLNFGNYFEFTPQFVCDNNVVHLIDDNGDSLGAYYREGFDYSSCN